MNQSNQNAAQKIRARYEDRKVTEMDTLRALDQRVKRPAAVFAYLFGSVSAIVMGCGMSLVMTDVAEMISLKGDPMTVGILIGLAGGVMACLTYPIYKGILDRRKKKYSSQILALSEKIMNQSSET